MCRVLECVEFQILAGNKTKEMLLQRAPICFLFFSPSTFTPKPRFASLPLSAEKLMQTLNGVRWKSITKKHHNEVRKEIDRNKHNHQTIFSRWM